jgi:hypothetical protein
MDVVVRGSTNFAVGVLSSHGTDPSECKGLPGPVTKRGPVGRE